MIKLFYVDRNDTYKEWELIPSRFLKVENIAAYLATKSAHTINDFQYVKNDLEIGINVDLTQAYSQPKASTSFKYVAIQNTGENIHYYFVKKAVWRSKTCVRFELVMDVLNTFEEGYDYNFKANTRIIREHKNRWTRKIKEHFLNFSWSELVSSSGTLTIGAQITIRYGALDGPVITEGEIDEIAYGGKYCTINFSNVEDPDYDAINATLEGLSPEVVIYIHDEFDKYIAFYIGVKNTDWEWQYTYTYIRNIDFINENINPVLLHKEKSLIENPKSILAQDWFLLYRNKNDPDPDNLVNPVECFLIPENETKVNAGVVTSGRLPYNALELGKFYWIEFNYGDTAPVTLDNAFTLPGPHSYQNRCYIVLYRNENNRIVVTEVEGKIVGGTLNLIGAFETEYVTLNDLPQTYGVTTSMPPYENAGFENYWIPAYEGSTKYTWTNTEVTQVLTAASDLDRTDAKHIKLIKLPYCPYNFYTGSDYVDVSSDPNWTFTSITQGDETFYVLKLNKLNIKLSSTFNLSATPFTLLESDFPYSPDKSQKRNPFTLL